MTSRPEFLAQLSSATRVTLVGPLLGHAHTPDSVTIYIDGGAAFRPPNSGFPTWSVGDGDSGQAHLDEKLSPTKDFSDLSYCLQLLPKTLSEIRLCGFLGGRRDHEWFNVGEANRYLKSSTGLCCAHFDRQIIGLSRGTHRIKVNGLFSVMAFEPTQLTLTGQCEYTLTTPTPLQALSSLGLSNVGFGEIEIQCREPLFIFLSEAS